MDGFDFYDSLTKGRRLANMQLDAIHESFVTGIKFSVIGSFASPLQWMSEVDEYAGTEHSPKDIYSHEISDALCPVCGDIHISEGATGVNQQNSHFYFVNHYKCEKRECIEIRRALNIEVIDYTGRYWLVTSDLMNIFNRLCDYGLIRLRRLLLNNGCLNDFEGFTDIMLASILLLESRKFA